eukprot:gnl/TRDRNA2_/TRDRNA2_72581_c0_seq1.p1 gnl/TRDRNA2_/TRDRNA2_72581_c0~~gnl/TRDRNA2_/TRDRNA2_72581_c0_seq1.p1  ORF type:complete len:302 (+),score=37.21 gnl/TRDRNA2_/TRDRNA2_72581_c0_seq1:545-1450(+)
MATGQVLALHHPELDDTLPKVAQALRVAEACWQEATESSEGFRRLPCGLVDAQRGLLVDLFNNFDGALLSLGCRLNHACEPALRHGDYGVAQIGNRTVRVAFACWNEHLDYRSGIVRARAVPLAGGGAALRGALAFASAADARRLSLPRLARAAQAGGAIGLLCESPGPVGRVMRSEWAQPPSRRGRWRLPAFVAADCPAAGDLVTVAPSAGKEFRATRDIAPGEELTISYLAGSGGLPRRAHRRAYLHGAYGFWCGCQLCFSAQTPRLRRLRKMTAWAAKRRLEGSFEGTVPCTKRARGL